MREEVAAADALPAAPPAAPAPTRPSAAPLVVPRPPRVQPAPAGGDGAGPARSRRPLALAAAGVLVVAAAAVALATRHDAPPATPAAAASPRATGPDAAAPPAGAAAAASPRATGPDAAAPTAGSAATAAPAATPASAAPPSTPAASRPATPAPAGVPAGWARWVEPGVGWSLSYPPGWTVGDFSGQRQFRDPQTRRTLRIDTVDPGTPDPVKDWQQQARIFARTYPTYRQIRIDPASFQGGRGAEWEFTYTTNGADLHVLDKSFVAGSRGFALYWQTAADDWSASQQDFQQLAASFRPAGG